jgi:serine/threonine protein phosphatase 1
MSSPSNPPANRRAANTEVEPLTFAIGDIHGRLDLLERAFDAIDQRAEGAERRVICLGDLVDRGPDSRGVIEFLMRAKGARCLRGNHEDLMLRALRGRDADSVSQWLQNGGAATLVSYGASGRFDQSMDLVDERHLGWIESLPLAIEDPSRIYVHAGLAPGVPLADQDEDTLLWIRERFLRAEAIAEFPDGKHIVHGHTPIWAGKPDPARPERLGHRTNLDTGAYMTGVLSVGVFDAAHPGGPIEVMQIA